MHLISKWQKVHYSFAYMFMLIGPRCLIFKPRILFNSADVIKAMRAS